MICQNPVYSGDDKSLILRGGTDSREVLDQLVGISHNPAKECLGCYWEALCILNPYEVCEESIHTFLEVIPLVLS